MTSPRQRFHLMINTNANAGSPRGDSPKLRSGDLTATATVTRKANLAGHLTCDRPGSSDQKRTPYEH
jgi:hypothetical protein